MTENNEDMYPFFIKCIEMVGRANREKHLGLSGPEILERGTDFYVKLVVGLAKNSNDEQPKNIFDMLTWEQPK